MKRRNIPPGRIVSKHARGVRLGGSKPIGLILQGGVVEDQCDVWVRPLTAVKWGRCANYSKRSGRLNPARGGIAIRGSRYLTSAKAGEFALLRLTAVE